MVDAPGCDALPPGSRVFVAGHGGLVGQAVLRRLARTPVAVLTASRAAVDLRRSTEVERWFEAQRPDRVVMAAAVVGGIADNMRRPGDFLHDNLAIQTSVIEAARRFGVARLVFLGSSCMYPRDAPQPMREQDLLAGPPEPTNAAYAIAKRTGLALCQAYRTQHGCDFVTLVPTNLYGPGDRFDPDRGHVIPALIRRLTAARERGEPEAPVWGSGRPRREFLHVDDLADAVVRALSGDPGGEPINIGTGRDIAVADLARLIAEGVGYRGRLVFDRSRPDGMPVKRLDTSRAARVLGWRPRIGLREGLARTIEWQRAGRGTQWT